MNKSISYRILKKKTKTNLFQETKLYNELLCNNNNYNLNYNYSERFDVFLSSFQYLRYRKMVVENMHAEHILPWDNLYTKTMKIKKQNTNLHGF